MRIFPEMCASTLCPFSSSTRNMALGRGSTTVPSTRIVSSLGFASVHHLRGTARGKRAKRPRGRPSRIHAGQAREKLGQGEHLGAALRDRDGVLEVGGAPAVGG